MSLGVVSSIAELIRCPLVLGRSVNLGVLKMPHWRSKPLQSGLRDENPYFISVCEIPSAIRVRGEWHKVKRGKAL